MGKKRRTEKVGITEAKTRWSEVLRRARAAPVVVQSRGKDVAVILSVEEYERLRCAGSKEPNQAEHFMEGIARLREQYGGGVDIECPRVDFKRRNPFAEDMAPPTRRRRRRP